MKVYTASAKGELEKVISDMLTDTFPTLEAILNVAITRLEAATSATTTATTTTAPSGTAAMVVDANGNIDPVASAKQQLTSLLEKTISAGANATDGSGDIYSSLSSVVDSLVTQVKSGAQAVADEVAYVGELLTPETVEQKALKSCKVLKGDMKELSDELNELLEKSKAGMGVIMLENVLWLEKDMEKALTVTKDTMIVLADD